MLDRPAPGSGRGEEGAAVVDFVLVSLVLIPLVLGIMQVALVMHVRSTLASAATEGARYAATVDRGPADGAAYTRRQIDAAVSGRFAEDVVAEQALVQGVPGVTVQVRAAVPPLGLWGPAIGLTVTGHAVEEEVP